MAARIEDTESGQTFTVGAQAFVNATGPFSDHLRRMADPNLSPRLRPAKGVHLLLPLPENFGSDALLISATEDGRVIFAVPWQGRLLVGTTETEAQADEEMIVTRDEAAYLLRHLNRYFNKAFRAADIVSATAGLRPLIRSKDARDTRKLIRDYEIEIEPVSGLITMLGGKWTVYRAMAQDAVDAVQKMLRGQATRCPTRDHRLFSSEDRPDHLADELTKNYPVTGTTAHHLVSKYGSCAGDVLALTRPDASLFLPLAAGAPQIRAEVVYSAREEMAVCVEDVLCRRTGLQFFDWRLAMAAAPAVAELLARELNWTAARAVSETDRYVEHIERRLQEIGLEPPRETVTGPDQSATA